MPNSTPKKPRAKAPQFPAEELTGLGREKAPSVRADGYRVKHNPRGPSGVRGPHGREIMGRNEIDPASLPGKKRDLPEIGDNPRTHVLLMEQSRDKRVFRYRVVDVGDPKALAEALGEDKGSKELYRSRSVHRSGNSAAFRQTLEVLHKIRRGILGIPKTVMMVLSAPTAGDSK